MKKDKLLFWTTTGIIVLFEGILPAIGFQPSLAFGKNAVVGVEAEVMRIAHQQQR